MTEIVQITELSVAQIRVLLVRPDLTPALRMAMANCVRGLLAEIDVPAASVGPASDIASPAESKVAPASVPVVGLPQQLSDLPDGDLRVYTDGACLNNQSGAGAGGWSFVVAGADGATAAVAHSGGESASGNNRMELTAILRAMEFVATLDPTRHRSVVITTDSKNAIGWLTQGWKRNNPDVRAICAQIDPLMQARSVRMEWVKGHKGNLFNEMCDTLATTAAAAHIA